MLKIFYTNLWIAFCFLTDIFKEQKIFNFDEVRCVSLSFYILCVLIRKFANFKTVFLCIFSPRIYIVLDFTVVFSPQTNTQLIRHHSLKGFPFSIDFFPPWLNQLILYVWIYLWTLYSVPLSCLSIFM